MMKFQTKNIKLSFKPYHEEHQLFDPFFAMIESIYKLDINTYAKSGDKEKAKREYKKQQDKRQAKLEIKERLEGLLKFLEEKKDRLELRQKYNPTEGITLLYDDIEVVKFLIQNIDTITPKQLEIANEIHQRQRK